MINIIILSYYFLAILSTTSGIFLIYKSYIEYLEDIRTIQETLNIDKTV